jgi:hypothetical protein
MALNNYSGSTLSLRLDRSISLLDSKEIARLIGLPLESSIHIVGYRTKNVITNKGQYAWNEQTGVPCIWILDMFTPSPQTTIIIPYVDSNATPEKVATTNYFGEIPAERIKIKNGLLFFKADGKMRGKLGINPSHARNVAGSFDALANILTITFLILIIREDTSTRNGIPQSHRLVVMPLMHIMMARWRKAVNWGHL